MVHYIAFCITMQGHVYPGHEVIGFSGLEEDKVIIRTANKTRLQHVVGVSNGPYEINGTVLFRDVLLGRGLYQHEVY